MASSNTAWSLQFFSCPDSRQYLIPRDTATVLAVALLSITRPMYPPDGDAFRQAVAAALSMIDPPPAARYWISPSGGGAADGGKAE